MFGDPAVNVKSHVCLLGQSMLTCVNRAALSGDCVLYWSSRGNLLTKHGCRHLVKLFLELEWLNWEIMVKLPWLDW